MQYSTFCKKWKELTPYIVITRPKTDLCWTCQKNTDDIVTPANQNELGKLEKIHEQELHFFNADNE